MTSSGLRAFVALARAGSVRAAAERLSVTQPAVTAAVRSLERELGTPLVARKGRGIVLTPAGQTLARYAARVLGLLEETRDAVAEAADPGRGRVRVAAVTTAGEHVLPEVIRDFRAARPGVDVALEVGNRRLVWERLRDGEADLAVGGRPPAGSGFAGEAFRSNDLVLVVPAGMTLPREPARPADLAGRDVAAARGGLGDAGDGGGVPGTRRHRAGDPHDRVERGTRRVGRCRAGRDPHLPRRGAPGAAGGRRSRAAGSRVAVAAGVARGDPHGRAAARLARRVPRLPPDERSVEARSQTAPRGQFGRTRGESREPPTGGEAGITGRLTPGGGVAAAAPSLRSGHDQRRPRRGVIRHRRFRPSGAAGDRRRQRGRQDDARPGHRDGARARARDPHLHRRLPPVRPGGPRAARHHAARPGLQLHRRHRAAPAPAGRRRGDPEAALRPLDRHVPAAGLRAAPGVRADRGAAAAAHARHARLAGRQGLPGPRGGPPPAVEGRARLLQARVHARRRCWPSWTGARTTPRRTCGPSARTATSSCASTGRDARAPTATSARAWCFGPRCPTRTWSPSWRRDSGVAPHPAAARPRPREAGRRPGDRGRLPAGGRRRGRALDLGAAQARRAAPAQPHRPLHPRRGRAAQRVARAGPVADRLPPVDGADGPGRTRSSFRRRSRPAERQWRVRSSRPATAPIPDAARSTRPGRGPGRRASAGSPSRAT